MQKQNRHRYVELSHFLGTDVFLGTSLGGGVLAKMVMTGSKALSPVSHPLVTTFLRVEAATTIPILLDEKWRGGSPSHTGSHYNPTLGPFINLGKAERETAGELRLLVL